MPQEEPWWRQLLPADLGGRGSVGTQGQLLEAS